MRRRSRSSDTVSRSSTLGKESNLGVRVQYLGREEDDGGVIARNHQEVHQVRRAHDKAATTVWSLYERTDGQGSSSSSAPAKERGVRNTHGYVWRNAKGVSCPYRPPCLVTLCAFDNVPCTSTVSSRLNSTRCYEVSIPRSNG